MFTHRKRALKRRSLILTASIVCVLATGALGVANVTATSTGLNWYSCTAPSNCENPVNWGKLKENQPKPMSFGPGAFVFKWHIPGTGPTNDLVTTCTKMTPKSPGWEIVNANEGTEKEAKIWNSRQIQPSGCTTQKVGTETACPTEVSPIDSSHSQVYDFFSKEYPNGQGVIEFRAPSGAGSLFTIYKTEGSPCGFLRVNTFPFSGTFTALVSNGANGATASIKPGWSSLGVGTPSGNGVVEWTANLGTSTTEPGGGSRLKLAP